LREIINPYRFDEIPVSRHDFFGREALVVWLEQQFIARRRVLIFHGPKLIGKTAFLHFLPGMLTPKSIAITFSLSKIAEFSLNALFVYFLQTLTKQVVQQEIVAPEKITTAADLVSGVNAILAEVQKQEPEAELLFLIDDFDRLLDLDQQESLIFLDACQALLLAQPNLRFILTVQDTALTHLRHPILDSAPTRQITTLNGDSAMQLITQPVEGIIRFDYGVTKRIAELNSNHPYYLTLFNHVLFNRYAREGWVNLRHLDETLDAVLDIDIPSFEAIWQGATWVERAVLVAMASVKGAHGVLSQQEIVSPLLKQVREADDKVLITALESLTFQGVLVKMGAMSYRFHVDLFRFWLQKHFDLPAVLAKVVWKRPNARAEVVVPSQTENQTGESSQSRIANLRWPPWVVALMGVTILSLFVVGFLFLGDFFGTGNGETASLLPVAQSENLTPAVPTFTPTPVTPEPTPTATPTPPVVVAKTLPSIAYMARQDDSPWQIHVMDLDGSNVVLLSDLIADDTTPVWSYQGDKLAFVSQRDNNREIYSIDVNGGNLVNLTNDPADDWTPAWAPDGSKVAFSSNRYGHWEIFIIKADGTDLQQITNTGTGNISPVWSPDGEYIAFSSKRDGNWEIYTMRIDGTDLRRLTNNDVNDLAPIWSFSGQYIAYETNIDGNVEIYVMTSQGGNPRNVSNLSYADDHGPVWSPDDERLIFYSNREGNWDLFSVNLDGTNTFNLTNTPEIDEQTPAWRP